MELDPDIVDLRIDNTRRIDAEDVSVRVDGATPEQARELENVVAARLATGWSRKASAVGGVQPRRGPAPGKQSSGRPIDVSVLGTFSNRDICQSLEEDLREAVTAALRPPNGGGDGGGGDGGGGSGGGGSGGAGGGSVCICASGIPGDEIDIAIDPIPWQPWRDPAPDRNFWAVTLNLDSAPFNIARLTVREGARNNPPVGSDQALIGLANTTDWAKEIWGFNLCSGRLGSVFQEGPNSTPRTMLLSRASCREGADTIVFRKPGFFGIWHDVGHFAAGSFWRIFAGTVATFTWNVD
jgi:hypothetical protein